MGFFTKLVASGVRATFGTVVAVVADTVTLGGLNTDRDVPYTWKNLKESKEDFDDALDDLSDGDIF